MKKIYGLAALSAAAIGATGCVTNDVYRVQLSESVKTTSKQIVLPSTNEISKLREDGSNFEKYVPLKKWYSSKDIEMFNKDPYSSKIANDLYTLIDGGIAGVWKFYDLQAKEEKQVVVPSLDGLKRALEFYMYLTHNKDSLVSEVLKGEAIRMLKIQETLSQYVNTYEEPFEHYIIAFVNKNKKDAYVVHVYDTKLDSKLPVEIMTYFDSLKLKGLKDVKVNGLVIDVGSGKSQDTILAIKYKNYKIITNPLTSFIAYSMYPLIVGSNYVPWTIPVAASALSGLTTHIENRDLSKGYEVYAFRVQQNKNCEITNTYSIYAAHKGLELIGLKFNLPYKATLPLNDGFVLIESNYPLMVGRQEGKIVAVSEKSLEYKTVRNFLSEVGKHFFYSIILNEIIDEVESKIKEESKVSQPESQPEPTPSEEPPPYVPSSSDGLFGLGSGTDQGSTIIVPGLISKNEYLMKELRRIEERFGVMFVFKG